MAIHLRLGTRLRMSGAILLLPLYAFKARTGKILPFISERSTVLKNKQRTYIPFTECSSGISRIRRVLKNE